MMPRIKICGLSRPTDIDVINEVRPDYAGFVFARSPRKVTAAQAQQLRELLEPGIIPVGVFVDAALEEVAAVADAGTIEIAQLHGSENATYIEALKTRCDIPVIKALTVRTAADIEAADRTVADILMLDNGKGTGERFDWGFLKDAKRPTHPWFLAGGITTGNLEQALSLDPWGIDVSSGVEAQRGLKDPEMIRAFMDALRTLRG